MQAVADSTRTLTKRNRALEVKLEEMTDVLNKERKGRRAREERRAAKEEVARRVQQQSHEEEVGRLKDALAKLEAKYARGVQQYEERLRGASEGEMNELRAELLRTKTAARSSVGEQEALRRQAEEKDAQARAQRVAHATQRAARRMSRAGLSRGFGAWAEMYVERRRRERALRAAGVRMMRPKLLMSYQGWRDAWRAAEAAATARLASLNATERVQALSARLAKTEAELRTTRADVRVPRKPCARPCAPLACCARVCCLLRLSPSPSPPASLALTGRVR